MGSCITSKKTKPVIENRVSMANIGMRMTLLDRFGAKQTKQLLELFEKYSDKNGMDIKGLLLLLPMLNDLPTQFVSSVFNVFDIDHRGKINFSNFCITVSQYLVGHRDEKCKFLFKVFDYNSNGVLENKELVEFKKYIGTALRKNDINYSHEEVEKTIAGWKKLNLEDLVVWAYEYLDFHLALKPFEVIPSPNSEKEIMRNLLSIDSKEEGEIWYLISTPWLETWMTYVNFTTISMGKEHEDSPILKNLRSKSIQPGARPVEINNIEFQDPFCSQHIREDAKTPKVFTIINASAWRELVNWYGGGPEFPREVVQGPSGLEVELFPAVLRVHINSKEVKTLVVSKVKTIRYVLDLIDSRKGRLYLILGQGLKNLSESSLVRTSFHEKISRCVYQQILSENDPELTEFIEFESGLDYEKNEEIEYMEEGSWLPGYIKELREVEVVIGANWRLKVVSIPNSESYRIRKPSRALITTSRSLKATGLVNLGNTCYMNAILQCINNTPLLAQFFITGTYMQHISRSNTQGSGGDISRVIGGLLKNISTGIHRKVRPYEFFNCFSEIFTYFKGNEQQDGHEFLRILLDSLHEDLNRQERDHTSKTITLNNPDIDEERSLSKEHWTKIQGSIGSVISDLCGGQTRNKISCTQCSSTTVIFEMLMDISLTIPIPVPDIKIEVLFIPNSSSCYTKYKFNFNKNFRAEEFCEKIYQETGVSPDRLVFAIMHEKLLVEIIPSHVKDHTELEIFLFEKLISVEEVDAIGKKTLKRPEDPEWRENLENRDLIDVNTGNKWVVGHVVRTSKNSIHVVLEVGGGELVKLEKNSNEIAQYRSFTRHISTMQYLYVYNRRVVFCKPEFFGIPQLLSIGNWYSFKELRLLLESLCMHLTSLSKIAGLFKFYLLRENLECALCNDPNCSCCEIPNTFEYLDNVPAGSFAVILWENFNMYKPRTREVEETEDISIYKCLEDEYGKEEKIEFNCVKCRGNEGKSKTDICRLPDILIVHLKRFRYEGTRPLKITNKVDFPLTDLDMSVILTENRGSMKINELTESNSRDNNLYDLFAVVNHSGNVFGGHYTCSCIGEIAGEKKWLYYDDDRVYQLQDSHTFNEIVTSKAYILFYKRQRFAPSNVISLYGKD